MTSSTSTPQDPPPAGPAAGVAVAPPTLAEFAAHLGLPAVPADPSQLQRALAVAHTWIVDRYVCDPYAVDHQLAELHMAARWYQGKGSPLGVYDGGDLGTTYVPSRNALVREMLGDPRPGFS